MQKRQLTTRVLNGSYEDTFRATLTVFQDQNYVIRNTDMQSGLIVAGVDRAESGGSQFAQALILGYVANKGTEVEISCMVNKLSTDATEIRLNIQEASYGQSSAWSGSSKQNTKQIFDPILFRNLFNEIEIELRRRQAIAGVVPKPLNESAMSSASEASSTGVVASNLFPSSVEGKKETNDWQHTPTYADTIAALEAEESLFELIKEPIYLNITSSAKNKYIMVLQTSETPMKLGDRYPLVEQLQISASIITIGNTKVILIKDNKVVLQYLIEKAGATLSKNTKLEYK